MPRLLLCGKMEERILGDGILRASEDGAVGDKSEQLLDPRQPRSTTPLPADHQ